MKESFMYDRQSQSNAYVILETVANAIKQEEIKSIKFGKEIKLSLDAVDRIIWIESSRNSKDKSMKTIKRV